MSKHHANLKVEIDTDPQGLGLTFAKTDQEILDLLNELGSSSVQLDNESISADAIYAAINRIEYVALAADTHERDRIAHLHLISGTTIVNSTTLRAAITADFAGAGFANTRPALLAITYRDGTRAEELFPDDGISARDVHIARRM